jgi:hypothetical protein
VFRKHTGKRAQHIAADLIDVDFNVHQYMLIWREKFEFLNA